jgi:multidrug efflux pump subunit AcrA (membrane-fusion protein)
VTVVRLTAGAYRCGITAKLPPMARERSLHELVSDALERAAQAQEESYELLERQREVTAALDDTLRCLRRCRGARARFGNGQRGAGIRARPG